ncbi:hypothetical protein GLAREA_04926 [Glarea lozoyensis ATCC 20868]|uniref:BZIP domain-containing protein n=1 Tax=Glarea lozoyensis (strain ATCC 20868 / MF5171) TaxID=1116229 RepID=S3CR34_GLAL2|nr:uncharacterized protein GLAREA_04926 [Glarea lozoyensis ATCC 20868]EPE28135.1 hypothetical protein GLAREA_04926 [Glarea lozoyensis ATCC 20868]
MDSTPIMQSYGTVGQWTDFSLYENETTFVNSGESFKPILSAETFPFETLTSTYHSSPSLSPASSMEMSFDDFYSNPTYDSPSMKEQSPPLPDNLYSIPAFYEPENTNTKIKQESNVINVTSNPEPTPTKGSKRRANSKGSRPKAPASPSAIERRRQQNRASQMAFRERTKKLVEDLRKQLLASETERLRLKGLLERVLAPGMQGGRYL